MRTTTLLSLNPLKHVGCLRAPSLRRCRRYRAWYRQPAARCPGRTLRLSCSTPVHPCNIHVTSTVLRVPHEAGEQNARRTERSPHFRFTMRKARAAWGGSEGGLKGVRRGSEGGPKGVRLTEIDLKHPHAMSR
eukprot:184705-Prorocentrum_minimum.AAC.1